ncbi:uncharacterized protein FOMMEDRAFT_21466 [Fomitiporia mediterranea MF3/22]|uniref:uncharacterized protein n=1 Tax=Fomitiporia mediterranea (strain MF3/22) TaxID=694068 RepID=UPI000440899C|nr:uncharacterized protein FOMMEDRAFT_21466 [Fomitiporia mediterranea MF3/22]EJD01004.1 hypothetical protein FOMMEDRAFT_21466 [Fomitiporia mediterranea MF3/22]
MAESKWPITQLAAHEFVNCAGSILFRPPTNDSPLQVCLLHHLTKGEWLLPKGRQDQGESLAQAAIRETYEETSYACELLPVDMMTRSPSSGADMKDHPHFVRACTEPFTVSIRHVAERDLKFIWWFISRTTGSDAGKRTGTQMLSENFESRFWPVDVDVENQEELDKVAEKLSYANDRQIVKMAIKLVFATYPEWFSKRKIG